MRFVMARRVVVCAVVGMGLMKAVAAQEILIHDAKSQPESLAMGPGGVLYVGSASSPYVYKVKAGATTAEQFVDASAEGAGTFFFGMLADAGNKMLWACQLTPVAGTTPVKRQTELRGFDLATGAAKFKWTLPGETSTCNDFAVGPDKALYITDTANSKIYKLAAGVMVPELFMEHRLLNGVDGITFLDGVLYVNNVSFNKLYRIPVDASGKPGNPVDIWMDAPVKGPDGMRAAGGKIYVAENGSGKVTALTIQGDTAHVTLVKDGLKTPTGVEPVGDMVWIAERGAGRAVGVAVGK